MLIRKQTLSGGKQNSPLAVATLSGGKNGWTACAVYVNTRGDATQIGSTVNVYGISEGVRALLATGTIASAMGDNPVVVKAGVGAFDVEYVPIATYTGQTDFAVVAYGTEPAGPFDAGGNNTIGGPGAVARTGVTQVTTAAGTSYPVDSGAVPFRLQDAVTPQLVGAWTPVPSSTGTIVLAISAGDFTGGAPTGDVLSFDLIVNWTCTALGVVAVSTDAAGPGAGPIALVPKSVAGVVGGVATGASPFAGAQARVVAGTVRVELLGVAAKDWRGVAVVQAQQKQVGLP